MHHSNNNKLSISAIARTLGIAVIVILPFQRFPRTLLQQGYLEGNLQDAIGWFSYIDEVSFVLLSIFAMSFIALRRNAYRFVPISFAKWIILYASFASIAIAINSVPFFQGVFGIYDVLKNIVVVYPFAMLNYDEDDLMRLLRLIVRMGVVLAVFGIVGEIVALLFGEGLGILVTAEKRYGLYRIISLTGAGNWNYLGVYLTLVFFIQYVVMRGYPGNKYKMAIVGLLVIFTFSRQVWIGAILMFILILGKTGKWLTFIVSIVLALISTYSYEKIISFLLTGVSLDPDQYFRLYGFLESIDILAENPFFGAGPGMFGGLSSVLYDSPLYAGWPEYYRYLVRLVRGIDQFWPVIWSETGLIGLALYSMIFVGIFRQLKKAGEHFGALGRPDLAKVGVVLRWYLIPLAIMGFAGGLNAAFVVFTYFALVGIYVSVHNKSAVEQRHE